MGLKFKCRNCGEDIVVKYLSKGEVAKCKACGVENVVPPDAISSDDAVYENYRDKHLPSSTPVELMQEPEPLIPYVK